jgi:hypothetical protein
MRMKHHSRSAEAKSSLDSSIGPVFRLFILYDSDASSIHAAQTSEFVIHELGEDVTVDQNLWNVRLLSSPQLRQQAVEEAALADMIIVAASNDRAIAQEIRTWTDAWQRERLQEGGLLAVVPQSGTEDNGGLVEYLREAAISANMDFLSRTGPTPRF